MTAPTWAKVPLEWRYETTIALCHVGLHDPDPDERVREFVDNLGELEAHIAFVQFAWENLRTYPAFMLEMEIFKVQRLIGGDRSELGEL